MKSIKPVFVAMLLGLALPAQGDATKQVSADFQKMVAEWQAAESAWRAAKNDVRDSEAYKEARAAKDIAKMRAMTDAVTGPDRKAFGKRALALADQCEGDQCLSVLTFAATNFDDGGIAEVVIKRVLRDHVKREGIAELLNKSRSFVRLIDAETTQNLLRKVNAENPHPLPRVHALLLMSKATLKDREATAADFASAKAQVLEADELAKGSRLARRTGRLRFEVENLLPGCEAPEISGEDLNGTSFKLSDYRGKVVLLDFWGFW
tara:strand:+ start:8617 stop:9408 length:792 start_codon:yes stop_codon:yes gene_type:complete